MFGSMGPVSPWASVHPMGRADAFAADCTLGIGGLMLNDAVVHELIKEAQTRKANVRLASTPLDVQNDIVNELVEKVAGLIGQQNNTAQFGRFRDGPTRPEIANTVTDYCIGTGMPKPFLAITEDCMAALRAAASTETLSTGGYLLFADYGKERNRFLLVAMIKSRDGITMEGLVPTSVTELDLSRLHQVARISFYQLQESRRETRDSRPTQNYLKFVSPKANQEAAGYFVRALGCEPAASASASTTATLRGVDEFFNHRSAIRSGTADARTEVLALMKAKAEAKATVSISDVVEVARRQFPPEDADALVADLTAHLQGDAYQVPTEFVPATAVINRFARFRFKNDSMTFEIEKKNVSLDSTGTIYLDVHNRRLEISDEELIKRLIDAMGDVE